MSTSYPRIRHRDITRIDRKYATESRTRVKRRVLARDVVRFAFYLPHDHSDIAVGVSHAVERYLHAVGIGPETIHQTVTNDDEGDGVDEKRLSYIRELLRPERPFRFIEDLKEDTARWMEKRGYATQIYWNEGRRGCNGYMLRYQARIPWREQSAEYMSFLTATVPTEYLKKHGAARVRELALEMASGLRFASGHVGLAVQFYWFVRRTDEALRAELLRYPGIDLRTAWLPPTLLGSRIDGVHWLNFLAQPVLGSLGGVSALRARLRSPETTVRELDAERVVVSMGEQPQAGDLSTGQTLPAYRELARVLEPWLEPVRLSEGVVSDAPLRYSDLQLTEDEVRRWWRRFLD